MVNYFEQKQMLVPFYSFIVVCVLCLGAVLWVKSEQAKVSKVYRKQVQLLNRYVSEEHKIPTPQKIRLLKEQQQNMQLQIQEIFKQLREKEDLSHVFKEISMPLELREYLADMKKQFARSNVGFNDYQTDVPARQDVPALGRYAALIYSLLEKARANHVQSLRDIARLPEENIELSGQVVFREYPVLISFFCDFEVLLKFLYDLSTVPELIRIKGISILSREKNLLEVALKVSYLESVE